MSDGEGFIPSSGGASTSMATTHASHRLACIEVTRPDKYNPLRGAALRPSHEPGPVLFADVGITKQDLFEAAP